MKEVTYFQNLDSLRFIAFFFVFLSHLGPQFHFDQTDSFSFLNVVFQHGRTAVSFFFVLSGFLISYLLIKERFATKSLNIKAFFVKRIFRILPLYFIVCIIGFMVIPIIFGETTNESVLQHLFLVANFNQIQLASSGIENSMILAPLWSIAIEEQFYLVWPFLLLSLKPKRYIYLFVFILLVSYSFIYLNRHSYIVLMLHTVSVLPEFMLGAIVAYWTYSYAKPIQIIQELPKWFLIVAYIVSISLILYLPPPYSYIANPLIFTFIMLEQVFAKNSLFKVSAIKGLDYLGKISYGSYMYHSIVLFVVMYFFTQWDLFSWNSLLFKLLFIILSFVLTIGLSYLSFNTIEKYCLNLRNRILNK